MAVADLLPSVGAQVPVVAPGGDLVADVCGGAVGQRRARVGAAGALDGDVDGASGLGRVGGDGDRAPGSNVTLVGAGDVAGSIAGWVVCRRPCSAYSLSRARVAGAKQKAGLGLPWVAEPPWGGQLDVRDGVAPVGEHPTATNRRELRGVADRDQPPVVAAYEVDQSGEVIGRSHARLVEDHGRARRPRAGASSVAGEEPGDGVGRATRFGGEHISGLARRRESDHGPTLGGECPDGPPGCGRLARAGGSDNHDEQVQPRDRLHGSLVRVQPLGGWCRAGLGPLLQFDLLVERLAGGEQPIGDRLTDRSTIPPGRPVDGRADLDAEGLGMGGEPIDVLDHFDGGRGGTGRHEVGEVADDVGAQPGGGLLLHETERLQDEQPLVAAKLT